MVPCWASHVIVFVMSVSVLVSGLHSCLRMGDNGSRVGGGHHESTSQQCDGVSGCNWICKT